jgi:GTPase Era involved in 16S rRNA processing
LLNLNFPVYKLKLSKRGEKVFVFDVFRKKKIQLTPEEWVRQHVLHYLHKELNYPKSLIAVEKEIKVNGLKKRFDVLVFNAKAEKKIIIECKAPTVKITQETFDQIAQYNIELKAKYLMVTNGLQHYFCKMDLENESYVFLQKLPKFKI